MVRAMATILPHRRGRDRRRQQRGGRRADDREGFAPLVMLVGDEPSVIERSEAILAKLRFAVTTSTSAEHALRVLPELKPDLVVAREDDGEKIRTSAMLRVPVVVLDGSMQDDPETLIKEIRRALRAVS
jgi:CheY-like chemotaxis protein